MDEKTAALIGAAAALTFAGRGLRPVAKLAMKGVVAAGDVTMDARRGISPSAVRTRRRCRRTRIPRADAGGPAVRWPAGSA